jgi:hypothetical protein
MIATGPGWELRLGRWQDVLHGEDWDLLCTDPPYSARTHAGHDHAVGTTSARPADQWQREAIAYQALDSRGVAAMTSELLPRTRGWSAVMTDHVLAAFWAEGATAHGRYAFSPLACVHPGSRVRMVGDGPAQWSVWLCLSRPRGDAWVTWGSRPGAYVVPRGAPDDRAMSGGKVSWLVREIVRDYSRRGELVCDPCAGMGTTLLSAVLEGRRALGAEVDPDTYHRAVARLRLAEERLELARRQAELYAPRPPLEQGDLGL